MLVDQLVVYSAARVKYVSRSLGFSSCVRVVLTLSCFHACDFRVQTFFRSGFSSPEVHKSFDYGRYLLFVLSVTLLSATCHIVCKHHMKKKDSVYLLRKKCKCTGNMSVVHSRYGNTKQQENVIIVSAGKADHDQDHFRP